METGLIVNKSTKYLNDIRKLAKYQVDYIENILELIYKDPLLTTYKGPTKPGNLHELKQFSHGNWKVMSIDVVSSVDDVESALLGDIFYYRGRLRLIYEFTYTTKNELVINFTDCDTHKYKNKQYSES